MRTADQVLAGLVPPDRLPTRDHEDPVPLADILRPALSDQSFRYSIARVDESGRVAVAQVLAYLGWRTGDRLTISTARDVVIVQRRSTGLHTVPEKRSLVIPASARRVCGIEAGDTVMLAAAAEFDIVLVHPSAVLDKMMAFYHSDVIRE